MGDFNDQLFTKVCELEGRMDLQGKKLYQTEQKLVMVEQLLRQALEIITKDKEK